MTVKGGIYKRSDNSSVGGTDSSSFSLGEGWATVQFSYPNPSLEANTDYWVVVWLKEACNFCFTKFYRDSESLKGGEQQVAINSWPNPWSPTLQNYKYSVYLAYKPVYTINKQTPSLSIGPLTLVTYGTATQTSCTRISGDSFSTLTLYRNGTQVATGITSPINESLVVLGAGTYNYTCTISETQNYTAGSLSDQYLNVSQAATSIKLYLNDSLWTSDETIGYLNATKVNATINVSELQAGVVLRMTGSNVSNPHEALLEAGTYNYTGSFAGNENYTASSYTRFLTITAPEPSNCSLTFSPSSPQVYGTEVTANCSCTNPEATAKLYRNETDITSENNTPILLPAGTWEYVCNVTATQNYTSATNSSLYTINKANVQPILSITPAGWTHTYPNQTSVSCSVTSINNEVSCILWRSGVQTTSPETLTLGAGNYTYKTNTTETANYSANNTGESKTLTIQQNQTNPTDVYIDNGTIYKNQDVTITYGTSVTVNSTLLYSDSGIGLLWENGSSVPNPYTAILNAGTYVFKGNTSGNVNYTTNSTGRSQILTVNKVSASCSLSSSAGWSIIYPSSTNVTCACTGDGDTHLYRDGNLVDAENGIGVTLAAKPGGYNYVCNITQGTNYNSASTSNNLTVNKGTLSLSITSPQTVTYPTETTVTGTETNVGDDDVVYQLWRDTILITQTSPYTEIITLGAGAYTYRFNATGGENWTANSTGVITSIIVNKGSTFVRLFLDGNESSRDYNVNDLANFTVTVNVTEKTVYLYTNITGWVLQSGPTPLYNYTTLDTPGYYNITGYFPEDENYTGSSQTYFANVMPFVDTSPPIWSNKATYPTSPATYSPTNYQFNVTWTDLESEVSSVLIEHDFTGILDNYTISTAQGDVYYYSYSNLPVGTYVWREYANNTNNYWNRTDQWTYVVNKASRTIDVTFDKTSPQPNGTFLTVGCVVSAGSSDGIITLYRNGTNVTGTEKDIPSDLPIGTWEYVCNITEGQNYTQATSATEYFEIVIADVTPPSYDVWDLNATLAHYGEGVLAYSNWSDDVELYKAWVETNAYGSFQNISVPIVSGWVNYTITTDAKGTIAVRTWVNDTSGKLTGTTQKTFEGWRWSNVTVTSPEGGDAFDVSTNITVECKVADSNTSDALADYSVDMFIDGSLVKSGSTNSSGYISWEWDTITESAGSHSIKCQINHDTGKQYSASDPEHEITINLGASLVIDEIIKEHDFIYRNDSYSPNKLDITARVKDEHNNIIENATVYFYDDTGQIGSCSTTSSGNCSYYEYDATDTIEVHQATISVNAIKDEYNDAITKNISFEVRGILFVTIDSPIELSYSKGDTILLNSSVRDENYQTVQAQVNWYNSIDELLASGEDTQWEIPIDYKAGIEVLNVTATKNYYDSSSSTKTIDDGILGWSNVNWISPVGQLNVGESITISCDVKDTNSSALIQNYPVEFYFGTDLLGSSSTDASGRATYSTVIPSTAGTYTYVCKIADAPSLYYTSHLDQVQIGISAVAPVIPTYHDGGTISISRITVENVTRNVTNVTVPVQNITEVTLPGRIEVYLFAPKNVESGELFPAYLWIKNIGGRNIENIKSTLSGTEKAFSLNVDEDITLGFELSAPKNAGSFNVDGNVSFGETYTTINKTIELKYLPLFIDVFTEEHEQYNEVLLYVENFDNSTTTEININKEGRTVYLDLLDGVFDYKARFTFLKVGEYEVVVRSKYGLETIDEDKRTVLITAVPPSLEPFNIIVIGIFALTIVLVAGGLKIIGKI